MFFSGYILPALFFIATFQLSTSLRCFVCSTQLGSCDDPFNKSAHTPEICDVSTTVCLKEKIGSSGKFSGTHRSCISRDHCESKSPASTHCSVCNTDLCNSSSKIRTNLLYYLAFILFTLFCT